MGDMQIRIVPSSDQPIYVQIADSIEDQIARHVLQPGERLPSARVLASSLGINMHTVLRAYAHLQERSLVEMRKGRGGVVVAGAPDIERSARQLVSAAQKTGMTKTELDSIIREAWE
jgi:DNA-binding transcriptional regulator YhcF (GntR family)